MPSIIEANSQHTCAPWEARSRPSTAPPPTNAQPHSAAVLPAKCSPWRPASNSNLLPGTSAASWFSVRNGSQVLVCCPQVAVGHALVYRPRHHLKQRSKLRVFMFQVNAGAHHQLELIEGKFRW